MKKVLSFLIAAVLLFSLAACGSDSDDQSKVSKTDVSSEMTQEEIDNQKIAEIKKQLVGDWIGVYFQMELLTFKDDGTGTYEGIFDKNFTFTYDVYLEHKEFANGDEYINNILTIAYNNGKSEEIVIDLRDENTQKLVLRDRETGYHGVINEDTWKRK